MATEPLLGGLHYNVSDVPYYAIPQDRPRLEALLAEVMAVYRIGKVGDEKLIADALFADGWRRIPK